MTYQLRPYQKEASDSAVKFFLDDSKDYNALIVAMTGSGKSLIISDIANRLNTNVLVFCPTKEILQQNYSKMLTYTNDCAMYSASVGKKDVATITFCTIGSVKNYVKLFEDFDYIIIDEAHLVNPKQGMYKKFLSHLKRKVLGLTATPYRLETDVDYNYKAKTFIGAKSRLCMLTNYKRPVFKEIIYEIDTKSLLAQGYLSKLDYYSVLAPGWNEKRIFKNSSGSDFSDKSVQWMNEVTGFKHHLLSILERLKHPKSGKPRNGILVFVRFIKDAEFCANNIDECGYITGSMTKTEREHVLHDFETGKTQILVNAGVLIVGYDRPDLDTVVLATPTMSLSRYTQEIGRCMRISDNKDRGWVVDLCGNVNRFGRVDDLALFRDDKGKWQMKNNERQLTNVYL